MSARLTDKEIEQLDSYARGLCDISKDITTCEGCVWQTFPHIHLCKVQCKVREIYLAGKEAASDAILEMLK